MTPKQKANEIVEKFGAIGIHKNVWNYQMNKWDEIGRKQCALIAVDEVIEVIDDFEFSNHGKIGNNYGQKFWYEVKEELEKL